ncbi:MAG: GxxExxY protein, partial [Candidatus Sericytochromatia bacterium]
EVGEYYADLVVDEMIILELKATEFIVPEFESQLINYLRGTEKEVGLLLNFCIKPEFKRKVFENSLTNLNYLIQEERDSIKTKVEIAVKEIEQKNNDLEDFTKKIQSSNTTLEEQKRVLAEAFEKSENAQKDLELQQKSMEEYQSYLKESFNVLLQHMDKFSQGDLTVEIPITKEDEVSLLYSGFNRSVNNIKSIFESFFYAISKNKELSEEIQFMVNEIVAATEQQLAQTSQVAAASEEMVATSVSNSDTALITTQDGEENKVTAQRGGAAVLKTIEKMNEVSDVVKESSDKILNLEKSSDKINQIVAVIKEIAEQTNLLSLNASIEAARAGEYGRGFSVVAEEIRKLAEKTGHSTKEVSKMIKEIQYQADEANLAMQKVTEKVLEAISFSKESGGNLENILSSSEKLLERISQIAAASEEQSITNKQISESIYEIAKVSNLSSDKLRIIF